jgi:uridine phosphorylase
MGNPGGEARGEADPKVWVTFALRDEACPFQKRNSGREGVLGFVTGMGRANARRAVVARLEKERPLFVISSGFAGALDPQLRLGDVVVEAGDAFPFREDLLGLRAKPVAFTCEDRIAVTAGEKADLRRRTGAGAVEMESGAIAEACKEWGVPMATVRVISDESGEDLPLDFNRFMKADQTLALGSILRAVAGSPRLIPRLLALQRRTRLAALQLAVFLERFLSSPGVCVSRSTRPILRPGR